MEPGAPRPQRQARRWLTIGVALLGLLSPRSARAEDGGTSSAPDAGQVLSREALFERAFGKRPRTDGVALLFVKVGKRQYGSVRALLTSDSSMGRVHGHDLQRALEGRLASETSDALDAAADEGWLELAALSRCGLTARVDPLTLELALDERGLLAADSAGVAAGSGIPVIEAAPFSGVLNLRLSEAVHASPGLESKRDPFAALAEGSLNVHGWLLEARAQARESTSATSIDLPAASLRLVKDDAQRAVRFSAGDVSTSGGSLLRATAILGARVETEPSLLPGRTLSPGPATVLTLVRDASVEIRVDGRTTRTVTLPPGVHDLRALARDAGSGDVDFLVTEEGMPPRAIRDSAAVAGQLRRGLHQFSYALGFPTLPTGPFEYDFERPMLRALHRIGITDRVTLGARAHAEQLAQSLSTEALVGVPVGSFGVELLGSRSDADLGWAGRLRYEFISRGASSPLRFGVSVLQPSASFVLPGEFEALNGIQTEAWFQPSLAGFALNLNAKHERSTEGDQLRGTLSLSRGFSNGINASLAVSQTLGLRRETRGGMTMVWTWPGQRRSAVLSGEATQGGLPSTRLSLQQEVPLEVGSVALAAGGADTPGSSRHTFESVAYRGPRLELNANHQFRHPILNQTASHTMRAELATAIVFVGSRFAISRPVQDSFALVVPSEDLRGEWIGVNPSQNRYWAAADRLGPAVIGGFGANEQRELRLAAPYLDQGQEMGPALRAVKTGYRTGHLITVGEAGSVLLRGELHADEGALSLAHGQLVPVEGGAPKMLFTNRRGKFALNGVTPGRYRIEVSGFDEVGMLEIPPDARGRFDAGVVVLQARGDFPIDGKGQKLAGRDSHAGPSAPDSARTVSGRVFRDDNGTGAWEADEPLLPGLALRVGKQTTKSNNKGGFTAKDLPPGEVVVEVSPDQPLPLGYTRTVKKVLLPSSAAALTADVSIGKPSAVREIAGWLMTDGPTGRERMRILARTQFPMAAWVAGLPLSNREADDLEKLSSKALDAPNYRLVVIAHAQSSGPLGSALSRAIRAGVSVQRYVRATQMVPPSRMILMLEDPSELSNHPLGQVQLLLVEVQPK